MYTEVAAFYVFSHEIIQSSLIHQNNGQNSSTAMIELLLFHFYPFIMISNFKFGPYSARKYQNTRAKWLAKLANALHTTKCDIAYLSQKCFTMLIKRFFNPIHHAMFSNWFTMRELIINSIWIINITNSLSIYMSCFLGLMVEQKTSNHNSIGHMFECWMKQLFFSYNFLRTIFFWGDIFAVQSAMVQQWLIYSWWSTHSWWIGLG